MQKTGSSVGALLGGQPAVCAAAPGGMPPGARAPKRSAPLVRALDVACKCAPPPCRRRVASFAGSRQAAVVGSRLAPGARVPTSAALWFCHVFLQLPI